ncbi:hypothetical protein BH24ACT22_BH24ACT22_03760 [soil metagenome]
MSRTLIPDLLLGADGARDDLAVTLESDRIVGVGPTDNGERLAGRAIAPSFVNDDSHAFQRRLRGAVEHTYPSHPHDDFWSWREKMYSLAGSLDESSIRDVAERCFREMLSCGYTSVTEFHYVHHQPDGTPYSDHNALAKAIALAAEKIGIRLLLLPVAYARGGIQRFRDGEIERFLGRVEDLREWSTGKPLVETGLAAHSVRAVPREWLEELGAYAAANGLPLHIHADEQPQEIEECIEEHGMRPVELLSETGFLGPSTTVVHATHADDRELDLLAAHGSGICACPTTEGTSGTASFRRQAFWGGAFGCPLAQTLTCDSTRWKNCGR